MPHIIPATHYSRSCIFLFLLLWWISFYVVDSCCHIPEFKEYYWKVENWAMYQCLGKFLLHNGFKVFFLKFPTRLLSLKFTWFIVKNIVLSNKILMKLYVSLTILLKTFFWTHNIKFSITIFPFEWKHNIRSIISVFWNRQGRQNEQK